MLIAKDSGNKNLELTTEAAEGPGVVLSLFYGAVCVAEIDSDGRITRASLSDYDTSILAKAGISIDSASAGFNYVSVLNSVI